METFSGLDPWWITGFCDSAASFTFSRSGRQIALYFAVRAPAGEQILLEHLQAYFACGSIYRTTLRVTRHDHLPRITEHFDRYPLRSEKQTAYGIWRGMVDLKREFRGRNREALAERALALSATQSRKR